MHLEILCIPKRWLIKVIRIIKIRNLENQSISNIVILQKTFLFRINWRHEKVLMGNSLIASLLTLAWSKSPFVERVGSANSDNNRHETTYTPSCHSMCCSLKETLFFLAYLKLVLSTSQAWSWSSCLEVTTFDDRAQLLLEQGSLKRSHSFLGSSGTNKSQAASDQHWTILL